MTYTGADLIADFISEKCCGSAFVVTGGACAFIIDAIGRNPNSEYVCFQHEQAASMAADAVWRTTGKIGVTVATSGPGATNLITGIACSWFDSIPSIHITGQVNQRESSDFLGANVRQGGFQETDIVSMVLPITKYAKKIDSIEDLVKTLPQILSIALDGRMGPVLIDIPLNIQKDIVSQEQKKFALQSHPKIDTVEKANFNLVELINAANRPIVIIGAGAALAGTAKLIQCWCEDNSIPYVTSWGALTYIDRSCKLYYGSVGVYGSRIANWVVQAADQIIVFGSRLDNRQRTSEPLAFAPFAQVTVLDIDKEELLKFRRHSNYKTYHFDLKYISGHLLSTNCDLDWPTSINKIVSKISNGFDKAVNDGELNPYTVIQIVQSKFEKNAIVVADTGANLCWVYQAFQADSSFLFTAGGNSPMGYSLPAAIGAQLLNPKKRVYCFIGDGGLQMNLQELQTIVAYKLPITVIVLNNFGYGIIRQFQATYLGGREFATGKGYTVPDFMALVKAYKIPYLQICSEDDLQEFKIPDGYSVIDVHLPTNTQISPKTELNHFIHDQFPYTLESVIEELPFRYPKTPSELKR
jgi:acetolactate synthase-1/2/3 large subunit